MSRHQLTTPPRDTTSIDYASENPLSPRRSKLAYLALALSAIACPFNLDLISKAAPIFFETRIFPHVRIIYASLLIVAPITSILAIVRIERSHGKSKGLFLAVPAFYLSALWWLIIVVGYLLMKFSNAG